MLRCTAPKFKCCAVCRRVEMLHFFRLATEVDPDKAQISVDVRCSAGARCVAVRAAAGVCAGASAATASRLSLSSSSSLLLLLLYLLLLPATRVANGGLRRGAEWRHRASIGFHVPRHSQDRVDEVIRDGRGSAGASDSHRERCVLQVTVC